MKKMEKPEDYVCEWLNKRYPGAKEVGDWTPKDVMDFARDYHAQQSKTPVALEGESKRSELLRFMEFAIDLPEIPEHSTKELVVDKYLKQNK